MRSISCYQLHAGVPYMQRHIENRSCPMSSDQTRELRSMKSNKSVSEQRSGKEVLAHHYSSPRSCHPNPLQRGVRCEIRSWTIERREDP